MIILKALENMLIRCIIHHRTSLLLQSADQYSEGLASLFGIWSCSYSHNSYFSPHSALICRLGLNKACVIRGEVGGCRCGCVKALAAGCGCCSISEASCWNLSSLFVSQHRDTSLTEGTIFSSICTDVPGERGKAVNGYISHSNYGRKTPNNQDKVSHT